MHLCCAFLLLCCLFTAGNIAQASSFVNCTRSALHAIEHALQRKASVDSAKTLENLQAGKTLATNGTLINQTDPQPQRTFIGMGGSLLGNTVFLSAFSSFFLAQTVKIFSYRYTEGVWDLHRIASSGGMPSSHAAFVSGLTVGVGAQEGVDSAIFALALVFSLVVMYDATGVRLHAGRQATALNMIISEMPPDHPIQDNGRLRDSLGHTKLQVMVGAMVGMIVGSLVTLVTLA
ncbi:hypothetical protein BSKO_07826 [Bryopsis sp. KO-2023]|nr:hypothetical protein BSKO_07826 [Bryopsis sp. KO-2023]